MLYVIVLARHLLSASDYLQHFTYIPSLSLPDNRAEDTLLSSPRCAEPGRDHLFHVTEHSLATSYLMASLYNIASWQGA